MGRRRREVLYRLTKTAAVLALVAFNLLLPGEARAQCVASGLDKICTNYGFLSAGAFGLSTAAGGGSNFVYNFGTISGTGFGVSAAATNSNVIYNKGNILGTGVGAFGISAAAANNIIINFGTISGSGVAISAAAVNSNTLTSYAGSKIIGPLSFAATSNAFNFVGGNYLFTLSVGGAVTFDASGAPFAVSGSQVAVVDPTPFAMTDRNLMDFTSAVSAAVPADRVFFNYQYFNNPTSTSYADESDANTRLADPFANMPGLAAYASDGVMFKNPTVQYADGTAVWGRGFAGQRVQQEDGILLHTLNQYYGGMIGGDWQSRPDLRLGAFIGAGRTRSSVDYNMGSNDSDLIFGGLFGRYNFGASFLGVALQGGYSSTDSKRFINNNLAPGGLETATASYDGWYISPEANYGLHYGLGSLMGASYTLTPSVKLRYLYASYNGYTESGTTAPLTIGTQTVSDFEERGQLKLTRTQVFSPGTAFQSDIYGGVLGVQRAGSTTIDATLLGQAIPFATPGKDNVWGGFIGGGFEVRTGPVGMFASAEYLAMSDDSSVVSGQAGLRVAF